MSQPSFLDAIGNPSPTYLGTIVALYDIGCLIGCIVAAAYGNYFGRCRSIFWASIIMVVGAIIQTTTYGAVQLIIGRLISGVGNGTSSNNNKVYHCNIANWFFCQGSTHQQSLCICLKFLAPSLGVGPWRSKCRWSLYGSMRVLA